MVIEERGAGGNEATLCNGVTAIVSGINREVKVMHPNNQGQIDPTLFHILTTKSIFKISCQHSLNVDVVVSVSYVKGNFASFSSFSPNLPT